MKVSKTRSSRFSAVLRIATIMVVGALGLGLGALISPARMALAQTASLDIETTETVTGHTRTDRTAREAWGLDETDWKRYQDLMTGPSGLWYSHLAPTMVLGINASSETERMRFARLVWEQEQARLDALFAFNRAYQTIARTDRSRPGFSLFEEQLLQSPLPAPARTSGQEDRIQAFVSPDCPQCEEGIRALTASGRSFDVYIIGADDDREIRAMAMRARVPIERVVERSITLNHAPGERLFRAGYRTEDLPLFFADRDLRSPVPLQTLLGGSRE